MNNMQQFDPIAFQQFLNMLNMGQNFNPYNLNNYMMQYNMMNPNFFGNNLQNQMFNNQFQQKMNIIRNGGVLLRPNQVNMSSINQDSFPFHTGPRLNLLFETGPGLKINITAPYNVSVEELLLAFIKKVGVSNTLLGTKLFFIVNGKTIPINEKRSVIDFFKNCMYGTSNQIKIIVIDANNVIGA